MPVAHRGTVLGGACLVVPALHDQSRQLDLAEAIQGARAGVGARRLDRRRLRCRQRDPPIVGEPVGWRWPVEEAAHYRGDGGLVPVRLLERVGLGQCCRGVGRGTAGCDQQQAHDAGGVTQHEILRHHATHRAADQHDLLQALVVEQTGQGIGIGLHGVGAGPGRRAPEAGQVRRQPTDASLGQPIERRCPVGRGLAIAVDAENRGLIACALNAVQGSLPLLLELFRLFGRCGERLLGRDLAQQRVLDLLLG